ncbi:hypothetical protein [Oceaniradius stylonematis]|uniref:hypothetical protein n=1 Tax=Oceaniradius stylonematis TaxID=2184161 RepID=UPI00273FCA78|nr:hypothetical protein [Oceaniradius stylonematis]
MAKVYKLHPKVRERVAPKISAAALAEYLIMKADQQDTVLHNSRYSTPPVVTPHSGALRPIRAYNADPYRNKNVLEAAKEALTQRSRDTSITPKGREESLRCIETIELFERAENAFGLKSLKLEESQRFSPLDVNGVLVTVQPDLIVRTGGQSGAVGVIFFRPQKAPDPAACQMEETRRARGEHRREMARYMLAMAEMSWEKQPTDFDRATSFVADIRTGERIDFSTSDHAARVRAVRAACDHIARLWDTIEPRASIRAKN